MSGRSTVRWFGFGILGIILLFIAAFVTLFVISGNRMRAQMAELNAKGHILTVDDLANIKVPDADNAALLYNRAASLVTGSATGSDKEIIENFVTPGEKEANSKLWNDAQAALKHQQQAVDLVRGAAARPKCWFPVNWKSGPAALFPHFTHMRYFARMFYADALIKARDGDMDGSLDSTSDVFRLSNSLKDEPTLIGQLVRHAIIGIGSESLRESLRYGKPNEKQAKRMYDVLDRIDLYPGFIRGMEGERALGMVTFDMAMKDPASLLQYSSGSGTGGLEKVIGRAWRTIAPMDRACYMSYMGKQIEAAKYPYRVASAKGMFPLDTDIPKYAVVTRIICPVFSRAGINKDAKTAMINGNQIFLALHVYKQRYGTYPADLGQLRKKIGWKLEKDPLTGKDLIYKQKNGEFVLYSVGNNQKDDGGVSGKLGHNSDDIVWKSKPDPIAPAPMPAPAPASGPSMAPPPGPVPYKL